MQHSVNSGGDGAESMLIQFANDLKLGPGAVFFFFFFNIYLFDCTGS